MKIIPWIFSTCAKTSLQTQRIVFNKGGMRIMAYLSVMTIGYVICLGLLCGILLFFIASVLEPEDAERIELLDTRKKK